ncbi:hypothetical protein [Streptomyces venezuelae]|uniref:hypothetical protein n=1 Tax=Streptomyces venezuelae TaxID=54571 RepID=UPI0016814F24|nr:hypothetical protein [Streptomyces venezuelae]
MLLGFQLDMGTVPAWFGGASLVLALIIFGKDHNANDRKYVDLVAVWWNIEYAIRSPSDPTRTEEVDLTIWLKNASNLPVEITSVRYKLTPSWLIRDLAQWPCRDDGTLMEPSEPGFTGVWSVGTGSESGIYLIQDVRIPPGETIACTPHTINIAHLAPEYAVQLNPINGVKCKIEHMDVIDNAGREWEVRPGVARRPIRMRWYRKKWRSRRG